MDDDALPKGESRGMTPGEIELAKSVFGNSIDYSKVRIHNGKDEGPVARVENYLSKFIGMNDVENRPQASGSNIWYPTGQYKDDFSKPGNDSSTFIHELTHVWQFQHGLAGAAVKTAEDVVTNGLNYDKTYTYKLDPKKDLMDYNVEQQANIVAEYFGMKERKAHPEPPPPPATVEGIENNFFGRMMLKRIAELHTARKETPDLRELERKGYVAYDKEGHPHFTQKFADKTTEDGKKYAAERVQRDADLEKVMAKFAANPGYVDEKGVVEKIAGIALKAVTPVYLSPLLPRR
ncbi:MAG: hypothetical protein EPN97_09960 [Alphaproteobacteria bacterium]|nr:MAG: hypothetical protein EPN97_09960 [Alphaproteobacteria bacterium]